MDMRTRFAFALAPALIVSATLTTACDINVGNGDFSVGVVSGKAQDEWTRSYDLKPGGRIQIINVNGRIDVEPSDSGKFDVRAERIAKARTDEAAQAVLQKLDILETASADSIRLQTKPRERLSMGQQQEVRYHLKVPAGMNLDLQTVNGGVEVSNVDATLVATTTNGGVNGKNLVGRVEASTTNGGIVLDLAAIREGGVKAETVNGSVQIRLPPDAKADIVAHCVNGGISVQELKIDQTSERSRRNLEGRLNGGGPKIEIDTTNGGIRIGPRSASTTDR
jgi:putative adhesin